MSIRVMVIDDSAVFRHLLTRVFSTELDILVVGYAANGQIALDKLPLLKPDLVTLDIEMPEMDGLATLKQIKSINPSIRVIMCSSLTVKGGVTTIEALSLGADDYVTKPQGVLDINEAITIMRQELMSRIRALMQKKEMGPGSRSSHKPILRQLTPCQYQVLVIGTSTGGPNALVEIITKIPAEFPIPILIVQHMPPLFTKLLAESLNKKSQLRVLEASDGDILAPGSIWIAPGNFHLEINKKGLSARLKLNQDAPENGCRPAVDVLFRSAAAVYGRQVLAVILTGMGQDGLIGSQVIVDAGGSVMVQDKASSVVWGMPGAVVDAGLADSVISLQDMSQAITDRVVYQKAVSGKNCQGVLK